MEKIISTWNLNSVKMKNIRTIICLTAMTLLAASCQKGLLGGQREIIPVVSSTVMTKASSDQNDAEQLLFSVPLDADNGEEYTLEAWISDTPSNVPETKGTPVTTGNIQDVYRSFKTTAFCGGQPYSGLQEATVTYSNSEWAFDNVYYWPSDGSSLTFCSVAPIGTWNNQVSNLSWNNGTEATFTYTLPSPNGSSDAFKQDDLLIAMDTQSAGTSGEAEINFHHALTFVDFIVGSLKDVTINSISLKNFYGTGTCTYTPGSTPSFSWSSPSNKNTYVQAFGQKIESSTDDGYSIGDWSKTFMMIPQQLPSDAEIVITYNTDKTVSYKIGADNTTKDKSGNLINNWSPYAGKSITFKVNKNDPMIDVVIVMDMSRSLRTSQTADGTKHYVTFERAVIDKYPSSPHSDNFMVTEKYFVLKLLDDLNEKGVFVSLVYFSSGSFSDALNDSPGEVSDTRIINHLASADVSVDKLKSTVNTIKFKYSSTGNDSFLNVGLQEAYYELFSKGRERATKNVVVLSDFVSSKGKTDDGYSSGSLSFDGNNAESAVAESKKIKDQGAKIYTVFLSAGDYWNNKDSGKQLRQYARAISSDYPTITTYSSASNEKIANDSYTYTVHNQILDDLVATIAEKILQ